MKFYQSIIGVLLLPLSFLAHAQPAYQWVQMAPNNQLSVRAILLDDEQCPTVRINNIPMPMQLRAPKTAKFPAVCERLVSRDTHSIKIQQQSLPTLPSDINRIAILGDTGCRIKKYSVQACNDEAAWPLRTIITSIAAQTPDITLHLGDYIYREAPCPEGNKGCQGSPSGYHWDTWNTEWFFLAKPLLKSSVIAFARGNHEDCNRAHNGWFRYLSPWAYQQNQQNCIAMEQPYVFKLKNVNYIMFDSSTGKDYRTTDAQIALYKNTAKQLNLAKDSTNLFLTHRPMWTHYKQKYGYDYGNLTQQIAFKNLLPDNTLILSGHAHYLQTIDMQNDYDQIIIGNSGTKLDKVSKSTEKLVNINKHIANFVYSRPGFGYSILTNAMKFDFYDENHTLVGECIWPPSPQHHRLQCK